MSAMGGINDVRADPEDRPRKPSGGDGAPARSTLELAALTLPQQRRLDELRGSSPGIRIAVNSGPHGTVEATVESPGYPPVEHIYGHAADGLDAADDMLAKLEQAIQADPDG